MLANNVVLATEAEADAPTDQPCAHEMPHTVHAVQELSCRQQIRGAGSPALLFAMKTLTNLQVMQRQSRRWLREGRRVVLVPTMGALA